MSRIKSFVQYLKQSEVFRSDCFEPLQVGTAITGKHYGFLSDDSGDEISSENGSYGELTGSYWVWRNYLPQHPEVEYIGFSHWRRFLDYTSKPRRYGCSFGTKMGFKKFAKRFDERYSEDRVYPLISSYDVILPTKTYSVNSIREDYVKAGHPEEDLDRLTEIVRELHPEFVPDMQEFLNGQSAYFCLNYLMRSSLFDNFMTWLFPLLTKLQNQADWSGYQTYETRRVAAYLAERFFNVWLNHEKRLRGIKVLERDGILLVPDGEAHWYDRILYSVSLVQMALRSVKDGTLRIRIRNRLGR